MNSLVDSKIERSEINRSALNRGNGFGRYLGWLAATFLALYLLPVVLLRMDWLEGWTLGENPTTTFSYKASGIDADVVILGESSSFHGIDPLQISSTLGVKAVNFPNSIGSLVATNDLSLETYLKHNRPPQLIVLYVAPWNLNFTHTRHFLTGLLDGEKMLLLYASPTKIFLHVKTFFSDSYRFPFRLYSERNLSTMILEDRHPNLNALAASRVVPRDFVSYGDRLKADCKLPAAFVEEGPSMEAARRLADRYRTPTTRVLVYLAPIPACGGIAELMARPYGDLGAAPPRLMPPGDFGNDGYFVHLDRTVVPEATDALIEAIRPLLRSPAPAK